MSDPDTAPLGTNAPDEILARLVEPPTTPDKAAVKAAAEETVAFFHDTGQAVLGIIERCQLPR
ncbi:hypothetical protein [Streptomyces sp. B21-083]|uniref:hypothetical protein n=1 Tax=Streptomyces sp. B21-083 TaxID=3039410 RepID=UPI002FF04599